MSKLLLASLVAAAASFATTTTADAGDGTNAPRPHPHPIYPTSGACKPSGKIIFQIDRKTDAPGGMTSKLTLDSNGAWTFIEMAGKRARKATGCLGLTVLDRVKKAVSTATWKTSQADVTCQAYSARYSEYRVAGRLVLTRRLCDGVILDAPTLQSMQQLEKMLGTLGSR